MVIAQHTMMSPTNSLGETNIMFWWHPLSCLE